MVLSEERHGGNDKLTVLMETTTTTTTSKPPLHNFAIPELLRWGNQKLLRCRKVGPQHFHPTVEKFFSGQRQQRKDEEVFNKTPSGSDEIEPVRAKLVEARRTSAKETTAFDGDNKTPSGSDVIQPVRAKLMLDLQTAADKMKVAILDQGLLKEARTLAKETTAFDGEKEMPWNLRTRRAACKAPNGTSNGGVKKPNISPLRTDEEKSTGLHGESYAAAAEREREKFSVSLSRAEIEEDFMAMAGHKPHRRPKKRAKIVQKQLDSLFPGLWLTEVTADMYKVADAP